MARSLFNANLLSAVADGVSVAITRRCYATTSQSQALVSRLARGGRSGVPKAGEDKVKIAPMKDASAETSWVPDPVTGFYRPANLREEIDAAELRQILLNQKH